MPKYFSTDHIVSKVRMMTSEHHILPRCFCIIKEFSLLKPSAEVPEAQEAPHRKPVAHPKVVQSVPSPTTRSTSPSWTGVRQIAFPQKLPPLPRFLAQQLLQEVTLINTEIVLIFHISSEKTQPVFGNPNERCYTGVFPKVSTLKSKPVPKCKMQTHTEISCFHPH